ncbi:MAG: rhodanese-like domain-containing protein [Thermodesulfovibrionales bacterium]|nr:rhodanese-like domain-containing protein [Thermodesulfovibrionales bacterium]
MQYKGYFGSALLAAILFVAVQFFLPINALGASQGSYPTISTDELASMHSSDVWDFHIIDARNPGEYEEVHIKGAILVAQKKFDEYAIALPSDKSVKLIFYCNGVKCGKSKKAAALASKRGYSDLFVYAEGMPVWEEKGLPIYKGPNYEKKIKTTIIAPSELRGMIGSGSDDFTVVDVRDKEEFAEGHMPGSINIPVEEFALNSHVLDKDKKIIVYCNSGGRSYQAYRKLMKLGYKNISQTIFADWKTAGYEVE